MCEAELQQQVRLRITRYFHWTLKGFCLNRHCVTRRHSALALGVAVTGGRVAAAGRDGVFIGSDRCPGVCLGQPQPCPG